MTEELFEKLNNRDFAETYGYFSITNLKSIIAHGIGPKSGDIITKVIKVLEEYGVRLLQAGPDEFIKHDLNPPLIQEQIVDKSPEHRLVDFIRELFDEDDDIQFIQFRINRSDDIYQTYSLERKAND